jgi:hypothetical protein
LVHVIRIDASLVDLTLSGWPTNNNYACMRLILTASDIAHQVVIKSTGGGTMKSDGRDHVVNAELTPVWTTVDSGKQMTNIDNTDPTIVEAFTYDGGATVYLRYLGEFI